MPPPCSAGGPVPHGAASVAAAALHEQLRCLNTEIAETVQLGDAAFKQLSLALKRRSNPQLCEALQSRYEHLCEREKRLNEMRSDIAGQLAVLAKGETRKLSGRLEARADDWKRGWTIGSA